jgi:hypothetical protein
MFLKQNDVSNLVEMDTEKKQWNPTYLKMIVRKHTFSKLKRFFSKIQCILMPADRKVGLAEIVHGFT